jgi:hypothetical protein
MTAQKRSAEEPFLNTVARKLGQAAGTLTNVAHGLTENLSAIPENLQNKVRQAAGTGSPTRLPQKRSQRGAAASRTKSAASVGKQPKKKKTTSNKSLRGGRKSTKPASTRKK